MAKKPATRVKAGTSKAYVYGLVDPRTESLFYIGKGTGYRSKQHEAYARRGKPGAKNDRIREIWACGMQVKHVLFGEFDSDVEAYDEEKRLIALFGDELTNCNRGGGGSYSLGAYGFFRARAKKILERIIPFGVWILRVGKESADSMTSLYGSPESFYNKIRDELVKQSIDPSPNVVTVSPDGTVSYGWEY